LNRVRERKISGLRLRVQAAQGPNGDPKNLSDEEQAAHDALLLHQRVLEDPNAVDSLSERE